MKIVITLIILFVAGCTQQDTACVLRALNAAVEQGRRNIRHHKVCPYMLDNRVRTFGGNQDNYWQEELARQQYFDNMFKPYK